MTLAFLSDSWTAEQAAKAADWCWTSLLVVWILMRFTIKPAKRRESALEMLGHAAPAVLGFWLLFENSWKSPQLQEHLFPDVAALWNIGFLLTVLGVALAIWARLSLGNNWSGTVTLKDQHELVAAGPYRRIRHPIYTGILLAAAGTAMVKGHLRGWLAFVVLLVAFYFKARREERFLHDEFGTGFDEHARRTGMFLPHWT